MKICPTCNQQHTDDDLSFCTSCGTPLPSSSHGAGYDPNKTVMSPPPQDTAPPSPYTEPRSFNDPTPSSPSSLETLVAPPSLFSDPTPSFNDPMPQQVRPFSEQPTVNRPFAEPPPQQQGWQSGQQQAPFQPLFPSQPPAHFGQQSQPEWTPPPPPVQSWGNNPVGLHYASTPSQTLSVISLITGIASCTIGLCCYMGTLLGPVAIITGIIALVQIKGNPTTYTGKGMAIGGIITGALYFVIIILLIVFWGALNIIGAMAG
jgi:hypothetical protein